MTIYSAKHIITAVKNGTAPTKERRDRNGGVTSEAVAWDGHGKAFIDRYRANWECPLDAYRDLKILNGQQYRAGMRFRQAYHHAVLSRRATRERLSRYPTTTELTMSEKLIKDACAALSPHNRKIVTDVCGHDAVIWSPQALETLKRSLGNLAVHWMAAAIEVCEHARE